MLKDVTKKRKSKFKVLSEVNKETSNFKSSGIGVSLNDICMQSLSNIKELISIPDKGQHFRLVTKKAINTFDFIQAILVNEPIKELTIAFYRIGKKTAAQLKDLQKANKIGSVTFLINDGFPKLVTDAYNFIKGYEAKDWKVKLENNHTKIILAKTKDNYYVIEGSGNMSINARIEQYCFDNNKDIYDFHYKWIGDI
jgi:hypothetical protein